MTGSERQVLAMLVDAQVREREEQRQADRELTRQLVSPNRRQQRRRRRAMSVRRCVYCGTRTLGRACTPHRDLIQLEAAAA